MMTVGGLSKIGFGSSPTFTGTATALRFLATTDNATAFGQNSGSKNYGMGFDAGTGSVYIYLAGVPYWIFSGANGSLTSDQGAVFISKTSSGQNAIRFDTSGSRLKFSLGGTTDYFYSDGSGIITTPGQVQSQNGFWCNTNTGVFLNTAGTLRIYSDSITMWGHAGATNTVAISGTLDQQSTPVGNVGAGEDTMHTFSLPASTLTATNRGIRYTGLGTIANDVNAKTLKIYFGSSVISVVLPVSVAGSWAASALITRTGASTQRYAVNVIVTNNTTNAVSGSFSATGTLAETETSAITIKATATATTDNDIVQNLSIVEAV